jgi:hypothetical protein
MRILLPAAVLLLVGAAQEVADEAVTLARALRKQHASSSDSEERLRLADLMRRLSDRASLSLLGEPEDPDRHFYRLHDTRNITTRRKDTFCGEFWKWPLQSGGPLAGAGDAIDETRDGPYEMEFLVDFIKMATGPDRWAGETTVEKVPSGDGLLVHAPPDLQRKVATVVHNVSREALSGIRMTVTLLASARTLDTGAAPDGTLPDEAWTRLQKQADEGVVRRLASIETVAMQDQTVASFSGTRRPVALAMGETGPIRSMVPDGCATELAALAGGSRFSLRGRIGYSRVLSIEDVATEKGTLRLPRVVEATLNVSRTLSPEATVVLGTLGPLPPEADVPPHLTVLARLSWVRP